MDHIEEVLRKFTLSEEERTSICLEEGELERGIKECELSLIGKVWGEKQANIMGIRSFAHSMWPQLRNVRITEIRANMFQFVFGSRKDIELVLGRRPWIYDGQPLIILKWKAGLEEDEKSLSKTLIFGFKFGMFRCIGSRRK